MIDTLTCLLMSLLANRLRDLVFQWKSFLGRETCWPFRNVPPLELQLFCTIIPPLHSSQVRLNSSSVPFYQLSPNPWKQEAVHFVLSAWPQVLALIAHPIISNKKQHEVNHFKFCPSASPCRPVTSVQSRAGCSESGQPRMRGLSDVLRSFVLVSFTYLEHLDETWFVIMCCAPLLNTLKMLHLLTEPLSPDYITGE